MHEVLTGTRVYGKGQERTQSRAHPARPERPTHMVSLHQKRQAMASAQTKNKVPSEQEV